MLTGPQVFRKYSGELVKDENYVANPSKGGSNHNRGTAVDVTLVDASGREVAMPSGFDDFSHKASRSNTDVTPEITRNLDLLTKVMTESGFTSIQSEWWHFDDKDTGKISCCGCGSQWGSNRNPLRKRQSQESFQRPLPLHPKQIFSVSDLLLSEKLNSFSENRQVLFVLSDSALSSKAVLYTFEKSSGGWKAFSEPFPAVTGKNGLTPDKKRRRRQIPFRKL